MTRRVPTEPLRDGTLPQARLHGNPAPWLLCELQFVRREAQAEAELAYQAWSRHPGRAGYAVYRAAQDRADAAQDELAACHSERQSAGESSAR